MRIPTARIKTALVYGHDYVGQDSPCQAFIFLPPVQEMLIGRDMHMRTHTHVYAHMCI